jgi:cellulose synthase/poly-beta-1,6-N-acetylglucosamine synthase-like glycosyltransferase
LALKKLYKLSEIFGFLMQAIDVFTTIIYVITLYLAVFWILALFTAKPKGRPKPPKRWPLVSVVVPAYNEGDVIERSVNSLVELDYPRLEIIIVNDGSTDDTKARAEGLEKLYDNIRVINKPNGGKWTALNAGLEVSKGEFFACLDADSFVPKEALKQIIMNFNLKNVAAVCPLMKVKEPKNFIQKIQWYEYLLNMFIKRVASLLNCIHVTPGPFTVYRKAVLKKLGGFREAYSTEDLEIALRLQEHHYEIVQLVDTNVYTLSPAKVSMLFNQRKRWNMGSLLNSLKYRRMLFNKRFGDFGLIQLPSVIVSGLLSLSLLGLVAYYMIAKPAKEALERLWLTDFDVFGWLKMLEFSINPLSLDYFKVVIFIVVFSISLAMLYLSHKHTKERLLKHGIISLVFFFFFYYLLLGIVWLGVAFDVVLRRFKQTWVKAR